MSAPHGRGCGCAQRLCHLSLEAKLVILSPKGRRIAASRSIFTPHAGESFDLPGKAREDKGSSALAGFYLRKGGCGLVLKDIHGRRPDGCFVDRLGGPELPGRDGDVLTGIITGFCAGSFTF